MKRADYRGHRGSVAGDDYHELWALRQSLKLLDPHTKLSAVTVEGLKPEDEKGVPADTWDGVDCTFYFGGDGEDSAERIVIDQVKYSAANRNRPWTIARLTAAKNKKKDNSVIGRLGKAFLGLKKTRPDLVANGNVVVRLVSNQPVPTAVLEAVFFHTSAPGSTTSAKREADRNALLSASGLDVYDFNAFTTSLDLSECGGESRFAHEERVMRTISGWTEDDARPDINHLLGFIRDKMLPESKGEVITRESIFAKLGFSDVGALFPCPSEIEQIAHLVSRQESKTVVSRMVSGEQRICLHGEGGCGKTTALQEITRLLPADSVAIVFDCYGGGRYLDSDAYRHRVSDAFKERRCASVQYA
jgi:ABC-type multidrug transport system fused ATPase/permease subunit